MGVIGLLSFSMSLSAQSPAEKISYDFSMEILTDHRFFLKEGSIDGQRIYYPSLALQPEFSLEWDHGNQLLQFSGFARWEQGDTRRTHWDIRELYWMWVHNKSELSVGFKRIFWGVTEAIHLVDIINQTDFIESFDGEQKLGQPMLHYSVLTQIGTFDLIAMPYFRKRQFAGPEGRFQTSILLEKDDLHFTSSKEEWHPSFALRWFHSVGALDFDLSHFYGVGREPVFSFQEKEPALRGVYPLIHQTGLALQLISGPAMYKMEAIFRQSKLQNVFAMAAGLEYTFSNVMGSGLDIGLLGEYMYDNRGEWAPSSMDNDLFLGTRFGFNDVQNTQVLAGIVVDLSHSSRLFSLEASRRFGQQWKVELEARMFHDINTSEFLRFFRNDSFLQWRIIRYF